IMVNGLWISFFISSCEVFFFFQAEDGIRDFHVTGVQTCALPISKVGEPDRTVWSIDGDGCFQMTNQELATCAINEIPIKVAVVRSEERRVGKEWRCQWPSCHVK